VSWIAVICFGICFGIILSVFKRGADLFSPSRVYGFVWAFAIGLTEFKLSAFQYEWSFESWIVLLTGVGAFLAGTFIAYVLNLSTVMVPIRVMRTMVRNEEVHEHRLFWLITASVGVYSAAFAVNYIIRGFLPIFDITRSRLEFNLSGVTLFLFTVPFILFFIMLYFLQVRGRRGKKTVVGVMAVTTVGSTLLLLSRYQLIIPFVICSGFLYYGSRYIRWKTVLPLLFVMSTFFTWVSSFRGSHLVATFLYHMSKMKFDREYAFFTEPYMYVVMNLENFARTVKLLDHHTLGYFTFDFITALFGLKYWLVDYFSIDRAPFLVSGYNTYPSLWWFYMDFGVLGVGAISLALGLSTGMAYYWMRRNPSIRNVATYSVLFFVAVVATYTFPPAGLFFVLNMLVMYFGLRWVVNPGRHPQ
jgi:oligosaccharide repeat unit polymerase